MDVYLHGKRLRLSPQQAIGKGGEADVFAIAPDQALKLFKPATHADYTGQPSAQQQATARLAEQQHKLRAFPGGLPARVVCPEALVTERTGQKILGYSMRLVRGATVLLRYAERSFHQTGVTPATVVAIFQDLHQTVSAVHQAGVVIGDFNDLNVLVLRTEAYLIDADSFQFGRFLCQVFTSRFVDPLLCTPQATSPVLQQPYHTGSDWYAFSVMLMQCLLGVGPYGGVYRPRDPAQRLPHEARPLRRLTVFHPEVQYPKPAVHYGVLPDEVLHYWYLVFEKDRREPFPKHLLDSLRWQQCSTCSTVHARTTCPQCTRTPRAACTAVLSAPGTVSVRRLLHTSGLLLCAAIQAETLRWLAYDQERWQREDGRVVLHGPLLPQVRVQLCGPDTLLGQEEQVVLLIPGQEPLRLSVDSLHGQPCLASNARHYYWQSQGQLLRDGPLGPVYMGDVLAGQTRMWVGAHCGFGYYRAGELSVAFLFDAERPGINDTVSLPVLAGHWIDATCVFSDTHCWFLVATQTQGQRLHHCLLLGAGGRLEAQARAEQGDGSWLGQLAGKCAIGRWLFAPTDTGIVRVEPAHGQLQVSKLFPETEPFVHSACTLLTGQQGLYVVDRQTIHCLSLPA